MSNWRMNSQDFWHLLEVEQDYKCRLTGWDLTPATTMITHKTPLVKKGKHARNNISLVHRSIVQLSRGLSEAEIVELAAAVIRTRGSDYGLAITQEN